MATDFFLSMFERDVSEISILMNIKTYNKVVYYFRHCIPILGVLISDEGGERREEEAVTG